MTVEEARTNRSRCDRPELFHRDHVLYELINGDLRALGKAIHFVCLEIGFIPV